MNTDDLRDLIGQLSSIADELDELADSEPDREDGDVVGYEFREEVTDLIFSLRIECGSEEHMTDYQRGQWDALQKVKKLWNNALRSGNSIENSLLW